MSGRWTDRWSDDRSDRRSDRVRWWSYRGRDRVAWVDLYTRQSLYAVAWLMTGLVLLGAVPDGRDRPAAYAAVAAAGVLVTVAATYALRDATRLYPALGPVPRRSTIALLAAAALGLAVALAVPDPLGGHAGLVVAFALAWGLGGYREPRVALLLGGAVVAASWLPSHHPAVTAYGVLAGGFFAMTARLSLWLLDVVLELDRARGAQAALAVAEERLRFSRDVHDVLGRQLSTIAVRAELAAALAARGDERAPESMLEVRGLAHDALRETRELARGYRALDLQQELDGASSLLRSAGIAAAVEVEGLPADWHEPAAWVVREAVTNVLRHSRASQVSVRYDGRSLEVRNDGALAAVASGGTGLAGLRERLAPRGAGLETRHEGPCFTVRMVLP